MVYAPDGQVLLDLRLSTLLRRENGEWLVVDARPYVLASEPA